MDDDTKERLDALEEKMRKIQMYLLDILIRKKIDERNERKKNGRMMANIMRKSKSHANILD